MIKIEITGITDQAITARVIDDSYTVQFSCGIGSPAHDALRHVVYNAVRELEHRRTDTAMRHFMQKREF